MSKLCPKIILEGTRLTHKTDLAFALNEHTRIVGQRRYRYHSPVVSGEWCAFTNTPWGRGLINYEPAEAERARETYETWVRLFELLQYYSWIVDRFHISTVAYQQRDGASRTHPTSRADRQPHANVFGARLSDFDWLEERLVALGFRLVFCTRSPASFESARAERLKVSGKPSQYDDLSVFVAEQEQLRELVAASLLPTLELDVSDNDIGAATDRVADWLDATGGLAAKETPSAGKDAEG